MPTRSSKSKLSVSGAKRSSKADRELDAIWRNSDKAHSKRQFERLIAKIGEAKQAAFENGLMSTFKALDQAQYEAGWEIANKSAPLPGWRKKDSVLRKMTGKGL